MDRAFRKEKLQLAKDENYVFVSIERDGLHLKSGIGKSSTTILFTPEQSDRLWGAFKLIESEIFDGIPTLDEAYKIIKEKAPKK